MWYHQESNRGHKDFQSFALPTELWHLLFLWLQRYVYLLNLQNFLYSFMRYFFVLVHFLQKNDNIVINKLKQNFK